MSARPARPAPVLARPEHRLLLLCARTRADAEAGEEIRRLVAGGPDWDYLYRLARRHAVLPLIYRRLRAAASNEMPPAQLRRLGDDFRANTARALYLTAELERVVSLFEAEGVPVIPYKGPALAAFAYGDLALRRYVDLDILVRKEDLPRAKGLLAARGFRPAWRLTPAQERVLLRSQHNFPFEREEGRLVVELHWELAAPRYAAPRDETVWSRLVPVKLAGREVKCLGPEDLLLSLCVHGTKHLWERLAWICDVAELLNSQPDLDWASVCERARAAGTERMLLLGLRLARGLLEAPLPDEIERLAEAEPSLGRLAETVTARLFEGPGQGPPGLLSSISFNLLARRGLAERVRYFGFIFTPTDGDLAVLTLPRPLSFVYYLLRPFRLLLKGGPGQSE
ncbi:MAG TPA: nucleotidyltransferase family protein [Pyrinomonadaceae bacterium]|nr:nucleotidyltransferase family protein [Pyrinomonadaceae bacterium]